MIIKQHTVAIKVTVYFAHYIFLYCDFWQVSAVMIIKQHTERLKLLSILHSVHFFVLWF